MGKSSRNKPRSSELAKKKRRLKPDDYFRRGPFELARYGRHVLMRSNLSAAEHSALQERMAAGLPAVSATIDGHVAAIVKIVRAYDPLSLLQRGYYASVLPHLTGDNEVETKDEVIGQRLVDYVQSIIAATPTDSAKLPPVTDEAWTELTEQVGKLFDAVNHEYLMCRTAHWKVHGGGPPEEQVEFYVRATAMWCNVTGQRYHFQEIGYLRELLTPHSAVFLRLWGLDTEALLTGLEKILHALTRGLGESIEKIMQAQAEYADVGDGDPSQLQERMEQLGARFGLPDAFDKFLGMGLFVVDDYLPQSLLDDLSWQPGECAGFLDGAAQSGWPTRIWPRTQRPFLKIGAAHYCFDVHTLFDHIYRVLERTVRAKEPAYGQTWNDRQKEVSENLPFQFFAKLLPGAHSWRSIYYEADEVDANGKRKWCELDGLIAFEDHLFIIEVKGGTFTAAPPETGLDAYLKSIERLVFAPVDQGERFRRTLVRHGKVALCDVRRQPLGEIVHSAYAHLSICTISLDPFTELSAKAYHLRHLVGRPGVMPFWALSLSDLMTYSDLFDEPLLFLHFVEKRAEAAVSSKVVLDDELDHYGMYLKYNMYARHAEELAGSMRAAWTGYRAPINRYFDARTRGEPAPLPRQEMPERFLSLIKCLGASRHPLRRKAASLLLDCAAEARESVARLIAHTLTEQAKSRKPKPFSIGGQELRVSFVCWQPGAVSSSDFDAAQYCQAAMLASGEQDRWMFELFFGTEGDLWRVEPTLFERSRLSAAQRDALASQAEFLRLERLRKVAATGRLGPNQLCPCGSGKKYKKCCRP